MSELKTAPGAGVPLEGIELPADGTWQEAELQGTEKPWGPLEEGETEQEGAKKR